MLSAVNVSHDLCESRYVVLSSVMCSNPLLISKGNKPPHCMPIPTDISSYPSSNGRIRHQMFSFNVPKQACSSDLVICFAVGLPCTSSNVPLLILSTPRCFERYMGDSFESLPFRFDRVVIFKIFI